ncbi:MAG: hypothetical protein J6P44_02340 [Bacteroidales bacterium]|nr:hypothetical protein [Bacteroidales bacterium]
MITQRLSEFEPTKQEIDRYFSEVEKKDALVLQRHGNVYDVLGKDAEVVSDICKGIIIHNWLPYKNDILCFVSIPEEKLSKNIELLIREGFKTVII